MATEIAVMSDLDDEKQTPKRSRCDATKRVLRSPASFICMNFFLSQWGDWMWQFAVGLYLYKLHDDSLILSAIYGLTGGGLVLLLGGVIGDWVDRNGRLKVVRISLFTQNLSVAISCVAVCIRLSVADLLNHYWLLRLMEGLVILFAVVAWLANVAYKIAIEKDWIVVIAAGSNKRLANLNAVSRSIDLICKVLSPTVAGFIMAYASMLVSAIVLAVWNVLSVFAEYTILSYVYRCVPDLAVKAITSEAADQEMTVMVDTSNANANVNHMQLHPISQADSSSEHHKSPSNTVDAETDELNGSHLKKVKNSADSVAKDQNKKSCFVKMRSPLLVLCNAWKTFARQRVVFASVSLALLYMTVLGFDSITMGSVIIVLTACGSFTYIYAHGISESYVGISMALGGVAGVIGTMLFTQFQRRIGLERTGLLAFGTEIGFLILAVVSIWLPGSMFDPQFTPQALHNTSCSNKFYSSLSFDNVNQDGANFTASSVLAESPGNYYSINVSESSNTSASIFNESEQLTMFGNNVTNSTASVCDDTIGEINVSIIVLLVGIVSSRIGLWMADLVVTQIMQEAVIETERGVVNGVQTSLNMLMDMLKFALVIALPQIEIFGIHILISYSFIVMAGISFCCHCWRVGIPAAMS